MSSATIWALMALGGSVFCPLIIWWGVRAGEEDLQIEWQKLQDQGVDVEKMALRKIAEAQARGGRARLAAWRYRRVLPRLHR